MLERLRHIFTGEDRRWRFVFAAILLVFGSHLAISFVSFFNTWENDQSELLHKSAAEVLFPGNDLSDPTFADDDSPRIMNKGRSIGAIIAKKFIHDWFGIGAFAIVFVCGYIIARLLFARARNTNAKRWLFVPFSLMIMSSLLLGFFANDALDGNLGGCFGYYFCYGTLNNMFGPFITGLILILVAAVYVIFTFKQVLPFCIAKTQEFFAKMAERRAAKLAAKNAEAVAEQEETIVPPIGNDSENEDTSNGTGSSSNEPPSQGGESTVTNEASDESNDADGTATESTDDENKETTENTGDTTPPNEGEIGSGAKEDEGEDTTSDDSDGDDEGNEEPTNDDEEKSEQGKDSEEPENKEPKQTEDVGENPPVPTPPVPEPPKKGIEIKNTLGGAEDTSGVEMVMQDYDPKADLSHFKQPDLSLLKIYDNDRNSVEIDEDEVLGNKNLIEKCLQDFNIGIEKITATVGPTITLYEIVPVAGTRISKIQALEKDIMMSLEALGIRIIAPIPGKGTVGIEVPNKKRQVVSMYSVLNSKAFKESTMELPVALGKTITNEVYMFDLAKTPHLLVAGATGQGKSVGLNAIVTSLLYKKHPSQLKFVLVDPKMVEFSIYGDLKNHYMAQYPGEEDIIITDCLKVQQTLKSLVQEMEDRYKLLMNAHCRNIIEYNNKFIHRELNPNNGHKYLSYIVIIIDEFGDFIMQAGKEIETPIARIAQKARAVGMHLILATQRPSVNIITGIIKANVPSRMAFKTSQRIDSQTILDAPGAEGLVGRGDLLISANGAKAERVQCAFVDTPEVERIVQFISKQQSYGSPMMLPELKEDNGAGSAKTPESAGALDEKFEEAARLVVVGKQGSTSTLQRKFEVGYNRAGRIMDQLEAWKIVGPANGSKARDVLVVDEYALDQILDDMRRKGVLK